MKKFNLIMFLVLAVTLGIIYFLLRKKIGDKLNPLSDKNLAYQGVSKIVRKITGDQDATLGTKIYDWVDGIKNVLPFVESDTERNARIRQEELAKRNKSSPYAEQVLPNNPSSVLIRLPNVAGDVFE